MSNIVHLLVSLKNGLGRKKKQFLVVIYATYNNIIVSLNNIEHKIPFKKKNIFLFLNFFKEHCTSGREKDLTKFRTKKLPIPYHNL